MKILYCMRSAAHFQYHKSTISQLCSNGHTVKALFDPVCKRENNAAVTTFNSVTDVFDFDWLIRRTEMWRLTLFGIRDLRNYARYLRFGEQSPFYRERWKKYLPRPMRFAIRFSPVKKMLATDLMDGLFHSFEHMVPPYSVIIDWLKKEQPDVVIASPVNMRRSTEIEYIKAAKMLKIPTVIPVLSWDNLVTKGLFQIIPDVALVWNRRQFEQAVKFQFVPEDKIVITGSPFFDQWFEKKQPSVDYASFCQRAGMQDDKPFIVYLGSSANIAKDETWLVEELARSLRRSSNDKIKGMNVLVRPHGANVDIYRKLSEPNVTLWSWDGIFPDTVEKFQAFYDTLHYCVGAIGLNTSGMIDAVIADTPCITIMPDCYKLTQSLSIHFQHLLEADVFEIANNTAECVDLIEGLLHGMDSKKDNRNLFVKDFIRPRGFGKTAGWIAAKSIEMVGSGQSIEQINSILDSQKS